MIPVSETREFARTNGVPVTTVERDYAQNWLLAALSRLNMALKGGTGIRKVYVENYRFSEDLDFTLVQELEPEEMREAIISAARNARSESGIAFDDTIKFRELKNGYEGIVYFRIIRQSGHPLKTKIDITKKGNEVIICPLERRQIIHPYTDNCDAEALTYSLEEIFAEKVRSLFQRTRPRDLYDVGYLSKFELDISDMIHRKFEFKGISTDLTILFEKKDNFRNAWEQSLKHQVKELPSFDMVFDEVSNFLEGIL